MSQEDQRGDVVAFECRFLRQIYQVSAKREPRFLSSVFLVRASVQ